MAEQKSLFSRLTQLFRSGPSIKRRVRKYDPSEYTKSSAAEFFTKHHSDTFNSTLSAYGMFDRMSRYSDFSEMEATPEIASALDIYSEETVSADVYGNVLHIHSDNRKVKEILHTLFYDTLNIDFNLSMWVRNLCKYGDFFLFNDISPEYGVVNVFPIPITEIEREEGFDADNPSAVRFRWITAGNKSLENWQVSHFRLLGNDAFLPYGSSVLESARRIWRQLILIEDAMLVYRVIRSPERRVFYIDVGNVPPEEVPNYLEQAQSSLKRSSVINKTTGQVDLRYNPLSVDEDYFIPVRGGDSGTRIDTLAGGQNTSAIEDVEYIQKKLFAALKIPKAYLGYDEDIGAKATLAQEDIRFSRTINRIQKTVISELNKIAMIHLYSHGFDGEELLDFELRLSNPSSIAQQQKLELISTKFDIAAKAPEGLVSRTWIRKNIMGFTKDDMEAIERNKQDEKLNDLELENIKADSGEGAAGGDDAGGDAGGGDDAGGGLFSGDRTDGDLLITNSVFTNEQDQDDFEDNEKQKGLPSNVSSVSKNVWGQPLKGNNRRSSSLPSNVDFATMTNVGSRARPQDTSNKPYDQDFLSKPFGEGNLVDLIFDENSLNEVTYQPRLDNESKLMLQNLSKRIGINKPQVLQESVDNNLGDDNED